MMIPRMELSQIVENLNPDLQEVARTYIKTLPLHHSACTYHPQMLFIVQYGMFQRQPLTWHNWSLIRAQTPTYFAGVLLENVFIQDLQ